MRTRIEFAPAGTPVGSGKVLVVVGRAERLRAAAVTELLPPGAAAVWSAMIDGASPGDAGAATSTWLADGAFRKVAAVVIPDACSRHNAPARPDVILDHVAGQAGGEDAAIVLALDRADHALAAATAIARAFPRFNRKSGGGEEKSRTVTVGFVAPDAPVDPARVAIVTESVRLAADLVDRPTDELHTEAFAALARAQAESLGNPHVKVETIAGTALKERGLGGLWGVGRAAMHGPALVVLTYDPPGAKRTLAWVGKGLVYDTGGLSLKTKEGMPGMKRDMGGAAAVLGAFLAAVKLGTPARIHALLCLAENAIGPNAVRNDDILTLYSGKTVELNNTDAEGRLVLGDGVAWASKHLAPDVVVDMATLTGAQLMATGKRHAGIVCNDEQLEGACVEAGRRSGDLVHPLPYAPELFRREFKSDVADLKNSVKDRMNAQSSCAAQFVAEHLVGYAGPWLHVDMAGPGDNGDRGTGYGVALLTTLFAEG